MTKISTYITTIDALFFQSTLEQTIKQSLLFSDEIVIVNSEYSNDGTQCLLDDLKSEYPNIIKLFEFKEDYSKKWNTVTDKKTFALKKCTGDYCILQDDDEMIHEKYANYIRQLIKICPESTAFKFNTIHFYRSYNHYQTGKDWYTNKIYMVKNIPEIIHGAVGTDLDNFIISEIDADCGNLVNNYRPLESLTSPSIINTPVTSYHYGWTRNDCVLLMKKYIQEIRWWGDKYWNEHKFPFKLDNPETLKKYEGTHPIHMKKRINDEIKYPSLRLKDFDK